MAWGQKEADMTTNKKPSPDETVPHRRFHKSEPTPSPKRDVKDDALSDQPYLFSDWASI